MSRIGLKPVTVPAGVEVKVDEKNIVTVKGPKGQFTQAIDPSMKIEINDGILTVTRPTENKKHKSLHGLSRTLINNMIIGVTEGYEKKMEIVGVGYRAAKQGKKLVLNLGFSHPVEMEVPTQLEIVVRGINKQLVGNYAAKIRAWREPEPYKGKGIRYAGEHVRRKEGKTGKK